MEQEISARWAQLFHGKTKHEIWRTDVPSELTTEEAFRFQDAQFAAVKSLPDDTAVYICADFAAPQPEATEVAPESSAPLPPLSVPAGPLDVQLERQIALCGGIIEHLAHYVARYDTEPYNCNNFMDRIVSMMNSSANAAKVAGRLRGSYKKGSVTG